MTELGSSRPGGLNYSGMLNNTAFLYFVCYSKGKMGRVREGNPSGEFDYVPECCCI